MTRAILTLCATALMLSGCGSTKGYPSLARRPQERITGSAPVVAPAPEVVKQPEPGQQGRLAALLEKARDAHERFKALAPHTRETVAAAAGAPMPSESWSVATVALAQLESRRSEAMIALADLDALYVRERIDGDDGNTIAAVRDQVTAWVADEDAVLTDLRGKVTG